jgi:hypothetical protein
MNKKTQIILVQRRSADRDNGTVTFSYRIAKLVGSVSVNSFSFRMPARVGDIVTEAQAEALASVREYTVTVTQQQEE